VEQSDDRTFLNGAGEMAELIRKHDWSDTPLGPLTAWPQSLATTVGMMIAAPNPMVLLWGAAGVLIYNDAYARFAGARHPHLLGLGAREGWPEIADFNDENIRRGMAGEAWSLEQQELVLDRGFGPESAWLDLHYAPVPDESGRPAGVMVFVNEITDRVRLAAHEAEAVERLELALSAGRGVGAWDWDIAADVVRADERFARLYGVDAEFARRGAPLQDFFRAIHPDDLPALQTTIAKTVQDGSAFSVEYRLVQPDGDVVWVIAEGRCVLDAEGRTIRLPGVSFDITERKRVEIRQAALLRLHDALRDLNDPSTISAEAARSVSEALGCEASYASIDLDQSLFTLERLWKPEDEALQPSPSGSPMAQGAILEALGNGGVVGLGDVADAPRTPSEAALFAARGIRAFAAAPVLERDRLVAVLSAYRQRPRPWSAEDMAFLRDVAERTRNAVARVQAEAERSVSQMRYQTLFDRMDEGFCIIEFIDGPEGPLSDYVHIEANAAYAENAGIEDVVGRRVRDMVPDEAEGWITLYRSVLETGRPIRFEKELEATGRWLELAAFKVEPSERGQVAVLFKDLTARKQAERAIADLNASLEARVEARTEELRSAHAALRQSQKMEAVGQLTGGIAHDFNNLLAGISGSLELISKRIAQGRGTEIGRYVEAAQGATQRAATLTQRLLAFSRRQTLDPRPTDANRLISGMEDLLRRTVGPNIDLEVVGAGGLWLIEIDQPQLENALLNLCINARDAMAPHGGRLTIETANKWLDDRHARHRDLPPGQYISICVTDTGSGMDAATVERIFEPFFTTKPIGQGTGLGLSMIHGFVRQSGGQVRVYSEIATGTTMCLYLPRHLGVLTEDAPVTRSPETALGRGETILVIDDEPSVRALVAEVLRDHGYTSIEACDGPSGLRILEQDVEIDLLVTDVGLPGGVNGRQVADAARVRRPDLKVLFITGYAENAAVGNGLLAPGMEVMTKPFAMSEFASKVTAMIETPHLAASGGQTGLRES
jgi:signal transduction histidine kinase/CheY-like chemotaxis protein/GAF domain-containing protein